MLVRIALAIAVAHILLLSLMKNTQLMVLIMCLRISGLSIANFSDKSPQMRKSDKIVLLVSHSLNTLLAIYFHFASPNHSYQVNSEWAMLVFDLLVLLIAFQVTYESSLQSNQHLLQQLSAAAQTHNFLVTANEFHHQNQALF